MSTATEKSNGSGAKTAVPTIPKAANPANPVPANTSQAVPVPVPSSNGSKKEGLTVDEISSRLTQLNTLFEKRERLVASKGKLDLFKLGADDVTVRFTDSTNNSWHTTNPHAIRKLLKYLTEELEANQIETDALIRATFE